MISKWIPKIFRTFKYFYQYFFCIHLDLLDIISGMQELAQELKDAIRRIMENFQEQNPMPYEEWEEGFRCDAHPEQEIAYWLKASAVFRHQAKAMKGAGQRAELYRLVGCCLNSNRENLPRIYQRTLLDPAKVQSVLDTFYGPG